jgi:hypothetical protein
MMGLSWVPTGLGKGAKRTRGMVVLINPTSSARTVARGVTGHVNGVEAHKKRKSVTDEALCIILLDEAAIQNIPAGSFILLTEKVLSS